MKILFYFSIYELFFEEVAARLLIRFPDMTFGGISFGRVAAQRLQKKHFTWKEILIFSDFLRKGDLSQPPNLEFLKTKERELGIPNLSLYIASDRFVSKLPYEKALRTLELAIRFVEDAYERSRPSLVMLDDVCCMLSYLIYKIGKKRGLPVWSIGTVKLKERISFFDDCLDQRKKINSLYEKFQSIPLTEEQIKIAESYREDYVTNFKPLPYVQYKNSPPNLSLKTFSRLIHATFNFCRDPLDMTRLSPGTLMKQRLSRVWTYWTIKILQLAKDPISGEKYVYFPLQAQPERTTLILAPFYLDQISLIENIAKSLPIDCKLYVKDHPIFRGRRPLADLQKICKIFNTRLIRTEIPSQELVKNAACVITISNTVGVEAIFFEKPLIVLGNTFYNSYKNLVNLDNIKELPIKIQETLDTFTPNREELLKFITAILEGTHPGERRNPLVIPQVMTAPNLDKVANAVIQEIKENFSS